MENRGASAETDQVGTTGRGLEGSWSRRLVGNQKLQAGTRASREGGRKGGREREKERGRARERERDGERAIRPLHPQS